MNYDKIFNCIIVDDEEHCIEGLKKIINNIPCLKLLSAFINPIDALREIAISKEHIDFLFLDIDMPKLSGLELAATIRNKVDKLIFVTAHSKYSLEAYGVLCNQYLLKPYSLQQFLNIVNKLIEASPLDRLRRGKDFFFIKDIKSGQHVKIKLDEIIYIKALEHYIIINTVAANYTHHMSMKEAEKHFNSADFVRIHKSSIISKEHIIAINGSSVLMSNHHNLEIGITYKQDFKHFFDKNSLR